MPLTARACLRRLAPPERCHEGRLDTSGSTYPRRRKARFTNFERVREEMARIYGQMESGKRDSQDGSRLVYVLTQIAKVLEFTELERCLVALETGRVGNYLRRVDRIEEWMGRLGECPKDGWVKCQFAHRRTHFAGEPWEAATDFLYRSTSCCPE